jgi:UDP-N-acetylglucosamine transferase subunit ALG13
LSTLVDQHIQQASDREEVEVMAQTMAEHLIEQGETRAKQEALLKLIRFQFESVPESVTNEITLIQSLARLDSLFERVLNAQTLDEIDW